MASNELSAVERQQELPLFRQAPANSLPIETIRRFKDSGAAITGAIVSSGLPDKQIYDFCDIDAGTFSKIKHGLATLQADKIEKFCYAVNNRIYPEWCAYQVGCTLVEIETETQKLLRQERERNEKLASENQILRSLFKQ